LTTLALSSFWSCGRGWRPLDFFAAGADLGFDSFELSGIHHDTFYDEIRPGDFHIVSLHDPAPAARGETRVGSKELRRADIVYTSLDEERRRQAVSITKRSIDVAAGYGARVIVLHSGQTSASPEIEEQLKRLFAQGRIASPEADALRACLAAERAYQHREHVDALRRSLDELVAYASAKK
jgi:sugar phosphate isomerase/epimerase